LTARAFYTRYDPRSTSAEAKSWAMNPAFLLCDDLQSHQPRANRSLPHQSELSALV
jgi:hypothetical protein